MIRVSTWWLLLVALVAAAAPAAAAPIGPGAYKIGGVAVDVVAANATAARADAYTLAERRAWPLLWARLTGGAAADAPKLSDGAIEAMVAGIEIEQEQFSLTRYIGRLGIVFDRDRASGFLGGGAQAPPMLLLPVLIDGAGVRTVYQAKTPWAAAWLRFRDAASVLDYVIPAASAGDNVVLTAFQSRRSDRKLWQIVLARFRADDVLTAEVRLTRAWPGGPVSAVAVARHGPDAVELGRVVLHAAGPAGVDAMLDEAVRAVDAIYVRALGEGNLTVEKGLTVELAPLIGGGPAIGAGVVADTTGTEADVATPDAASWAAIFADLRATPGVTDVRLLRLALGAVSRIVIRHADSDAALAFHLDQHGWRLAPGPGGVLLRRRQPGDPVVPPPPTPADLAGAEIVAEPDAAPLPPAVKPVAPVAPATKPPARPRDPLAPR
jgi:hypothetical protein